MVLDPLVLAQFAVAAGTIVLAVVAALQIGKSREQIQQATRAIEATERATEATRQAAAETARSRIDALAFRLAVEMRTPDWPPVVNPNLKKMPGGGEPSLFDEVNVRRSRPVTNDDVFQLPRQERELLYFRVVGVIRNEGLGTAVLALKSTIRLLHEGPETEGIDGLIVSPRFVGEWTPKVVVEPGKTLVFEWQAGRPIADWIDAYEHPDPPNPRGHVELSLAASDRSVDAVTDNLFIRAAGRPLEPIPNETGRWRLAQDRRFVAHTYPSIRRRRGIDEWDIKPPWHDRDGETANTQAETTHE